MNISYRETADISDPMAAQHRCIIIDFDLPHVLNHRHTPAIILKALHNTMEGLLQAPPTGPEPVHHHPDPTLPGL